VFILEDNLAEIVADRIDYGLINSGIEISIVFILEDNLAEIVADRIDCFE